MSPQPIHLRRKRSCGLRKKLVFEVAEPRILLTDFVVTSTADSGDGTLRRAIEQANASNGDDVIRFDIPATDAGHLYYRDDGTPGSVSLDHVTVTSSTEDDDIADIDPDWPRSWFSIAVTSPLPAITDSVVLDGYAQPGAVENTSPTHSNAVLRIEVNGEGAGEAPNGMLQILGSEVVIKGIAVNRVQGSKIQIEQEFSDVPVSNNRIEGSFLGTDISGTLAFPPAVAVASMRYDGVGIRNASDNVIGGSEPASRNVIAGNNTSPAAGVFIEGTLARANAVRGSLIGTAADGVSPLGNEEAGVTVASNGGHFVGGEQSADGNVISANTIGVLVRGRNLVIQNNAIGTSAVGSENVGNSAVGVLVSINVSGTTITENTIAFNGHSPPSGGISGVSLPAGVRIQSGSLAGNGNLISRNAIRRNIGPGIDLRDDGVTPNDTPPFSSPPDRDTGPNALQNSPRLTSVRETDGETFVEGSLESTPDSSFRIEFFANSRRDENSFAGLAGSIVPGQHGEGEVYLGELVVTTDSSGISEFSLPLGGISDSLPFVTATATDITEEGGNPRNNTSEFSPVEPLGGPSFVVSNTGDVGLGTLREAIINANIAPGQQTIEFAIGNDDPRHFFYADDGTDGSVSTELIRATDAMDDSELAGVDPDWPHSWFSLRPEIAIPEIVDSIVIDGFSQNGGARNTAPTPLPLDLLSKIELDGTDVSGDGLHLSIGAEVSRIEGLVINRFSGNGIVLDTFGGNLIAGNFIGTDVSGTLDQGNSEDGVLLTGELFNRIGGTVPEMRNLIAGNDGNQIEVRSSGANVIEGNLLGTDRAGQRVLSSDATVLLAGSFFEVIGGVESSSRNLIASESTGIVVTATDAEDPFPPSDPADAIDSCGADLQTVRNQRAAFFESDELEDFERTFRSTQPLILCAGADNFLGLAQGNAILGNDSLIGAGAFVDLGDDGPTPNDIGDVDGGPNNYQNTPVLISAISSPAGTDILGSLESAPATSFRVEFFALTDAGGPFEAGSYLGAVNATTDANGFAEFAFASASPFPSGSLVTATATRLFQLDGDETPSNLFETSEPSPAVAVATDGAQPGDVNGDGTLDAADIDFLHEAIASGTTAPELDLNSDNAVDAADVDFVLTTLLGSHRGDTDLDGDVDFQDFLLFSAGFGSFERSWAAGDFDGSGETDFADFLTMAANFGAI